MPFVFELEDDFDLPRQEDHDIWAIDIGLGYDVEKDLAVVMSVMLVQGDVVLDGKVRRAFDLQFGIRKKSHDRISEPDFDKKTGRDFIPESRNSDVLEAIQRAAIRLVSLLQPHHLTMESYHSFLAPKALTKYEIICARLVDRGYEVADAFREPSTGINYWYLRRR